MIPSSIMILIPFLCASSPKFLYYFCRIYWYLSSFVLFMTKTLPTKYDMAYFLEGEYNALFIGARIKVLYAYSELKKFDALSIRPSFLMSLLNLWITSVFFSLNLMMTNWPSLYPSRTVPSNPHTLDDIYLYLKSIIWIIEITDRSLIPASSMFVIPFLREWSFAIMKKVMHATPTGYSTENINRLLFY